MQLIERSVSSSLFDPPPSRPQFMLCQSVQFCGGAGTVRSCRPTAGTWTYTVEMELGPEPEVGRIGFETTILLAESELSAAPS
jgi:hypothetical protein